MPILFPSVMDSERAFLLFALQISGVGMSLADLRNKFYTGVVNGTILLGGTPVPGSNPEGLVIRNETTGVWTARPTGFVRIRFYGSDGIILGQPADPPDFINGTDIREIPR